MAPLPPTQRDVDAAYRMALADLADLRRCRAEKQPAAVMAAAKQAYDASERHWRDTRKAFEAATK